uniref:Uncharacterized protein n=1 Tax=Nymphaea colorata TaxID=210225 RepID=A0A5K0VYR3_9MAGN
MVAWNSALSFSTHEAENQLSLLNNHHGFDGSHRNRSNGITKSERDIEFEPINSVISFFFFQFGVESKKLWYFAGPAIFTSLCRYSLGAITQVFVGHVGTPSS